ncbi:MAG: hypothetical protein ACT4QE_19040, partial [Anaerolineales bacterium]
MKVAAGGAFVVEAAEGFHGGDNMFQHHLRSMRKLDLRRWFMRFVFAFLIVTLVTAGSLQSSFAHLDVDLPELSFHPYHFNADREDTGPINVIFIGDLNTTLEGFDRHFPGSGDPLISSVMQFDDHEVVDDRDAERAVGNIRDRLHIRFEQGHDTDPVLGAYTLASVHKDVLVIGGQCIVNHKGTEFNEQRDRIVRAFRASGHTVTYVNLGNNTPLRQCDG